MGFRIYDKERGCRPSKQEKYTMLIFALLVVPISLCPVAFHSKYWGAVCLIALAASSHQAWSANIFTTVSDAFPKKLSALLQESEEWLVQ